MHILIDYIYISLKYIKSNRNINTMAGGLIQLAAYGAENKYLMGNPQITFFKLVYKRHTNFSMESVEVAFEGNSNISEVSQTTTKLRVNVPRVGDLLHKMFLKIKLPNILSSNLKKFKWVKNLGEAFIQSISYYIGGQKIESITGEWIHIYHETNLDEAKKKIYDQMIGNTPDLYDPDKIALELLESLEKSYINNSSPRSYIRKLYRSGKPYYDVQEESVEEQGLIPSIIGRTLYVPIPFSFCRNIGLSLPLLSLQYHDVEIVLETNPIMNLFTILDETTKLRRHPNTLKSDHKLSYYVYTDKVKNNIHQNNLALYDEIDDLIELERHIQQQYNNLNFSLDVHLELFYIFLDENERTNFVNMSHEYLIEQVTYLTESGFHGQNNTFNMSLYNPTKEIFWTLKRDDLSKYNIWFNYTNHIYPEKSYWSQDINNEYQSNNKSIKVSNYNWRQFQSNILVNAKFQFNSLDRINYKDDIYFNYLTPYLHHSNTQKGIYNYSFALEPEKYQPSGTVNLSMVSKVSLDFETIQPPIDPEIEHILKNYNDLGTNIDKKKIINNLGLEYNEETDSPFIKDKQIYKYTYQLGVFVVSYNILKIVGGMGGLTYTK